MLRDAVENGFPRTYRVKERTRHAVNFVIVAVCGLFLSITILDLSRVLPYRGSLSDLLLMDLICAGIALFLGSGYNKRVILHADAIEVKGWFRSRSLFFSDIRGRQTNASSGGVYGYAYIFVPGDGKRKLAVPCSILQTDQFFRDWIKTIPKIPRR